MGFFQAILDAIANNYIFFVAITIFLVLSLIGFYVDKKTRKDADITPIFGAKISLNRKAKDPDAKKAKKSKKGKSSFTTTIVGGEDPAPAGVATAANQNATVGNVAQANIQADQNQGINTINAQGTFNGNVVPTSQVPNVDLNAQQVVANTQIQTLPDGTPIDPSLFANIPGQENTTYVMPAAETAQISDTILPNVTTTPVQAQIQGESAAAPGMESIVPNVINEQVPQSDFESEGINMNMGTEDEGSGMNFNMTEE